MHTNTVMIGGTKSDSVEVLVDVLRDRLNLSAELALDLEHVVLVVFGNKIDGETEVAKSS